MRILVVSDTHGDFYNLKKVLDTHKNAEVIIHCGDSRDELDIIKMMYSDKALFAVKGNCDLGSVLPTDEIRVIGGKKFFITHGHMYDVKSSLYYLRAAARAQGADIVLYGHTHNALTQYDDDMLILNPGSLNGYGASYAYIDIVDGKVLSNIVKVN